MRPEIAGPIAGATDMTIEIRPMMRPRSPSGTNVRTVVISSGIMIAVPEACTTRPTISTLNPGDVAAIRVPAENNDIASDGTPAAY